MTTPNASIQTTSTVGTIADRTQKLDWIIPLAIHIVIFLIALWMLISLVHYGVKTKKWCRHQTNNSDKLSTGLVYTSAVACASVCLLFIAINIAYINVAFTDGNDELCDSVSDGALVMYGLIIFCVYLFLWFRQRVFYKNFLLNAGYSNLLRALSSLSIVFVAVAGTSTVIFNALPNDHLSSPDGCLYMPHEELKVGYWISVVVVVVFGQAMMLGLFVYALKKTTGEEWSIVFCCFCGTQSNRIPSSKKVSHVRSISYSSSVENAHSNKTRSKSFSQEDQPMIVRRILWKTLIFAFLSTIVDILVQVMIFYITKPGSNRRISASVTGVAALINVLFVLLSFVSYKEILTSVWKSIRENWSANHSQSSTDVTNV